MGTTRRRPPRPNVQLRYEAIEQQVIAFQQGDSEAALGVLEAMRPYLLKYVRLLRQGQVNWADYDSRCFISLLIPDPDLRRAVLRSRQTPTTRARALHYLRVLITALRPVPQADLEQEMAAVLLALARRYRPKPHRNFVGYVAGKRGAFKYALLRSLKAIVADPSVFQAFTGGAIAFDEHIHAVIYDDPAEVVEGSLSAEWVRGDVAGPPFDRLTPDERMALKLRYEQGLSDEEAASAMGRTPAEYRRLLRQAVATLREDRMDGTPQDSCPPAQASEGDDTASNPGAPDVPDPSGAVR